MIEYYVLGIAVSVWCSFGLGVALISVIADHINEEHDSAWEWINSFLWCIPLWPVYLVVCGVDDIKRASASVSGGNHAKEN